MMKSYLSLDEMRAMRSLNNGQSNEQSEILELLEIVATKIVENGEKIENMTMVVELETSILKKEIDGLRKMMSKQDETIDELKADKEKLRSDLSQVSSDYYYDHGVYGTGE